MILSVAIWATHLAAGMGILSIMHSRGCNQYERLFWTSAALATVLRPLSGYGSETAAWAEAFFVGAFAVVILLGNRPPLLPPARTELTCLTPECRE